MVTERCENVVVLLLQILAVRALSEGMISGCGALVSRTGLRVSAKHGIRCRKSFETEVITWPESGWGAFRLYGKDIAGNTASGARITIVRLPSR